MIYIYDILANFIDGSRIYEFFEWNSKDSILHINKIPLIKVSDKVFNDLVYKDIRVEENLLELIEDKCYSYKEKIKYAACFTNGVKCYIIEFNNKKENVFKSSLLLDEEEDIIACSKRLNILKFNYVVVKDYQNTLNKLTREEEKKYNIVLKDLERSYQEKNIDKINYLYSEIFLNDDTDINIKYQKLVDNINNSNLSKIYNILKLEKKKAS